jgi:hypothetical protein
VEGSKCPFGYTVRISFFLNIVCKVIELTNFSNYQREAATDGKCPLGFQVKFLFRFSNELCQINRWLLVFISGTPSWKRMPPRTQGTVKLALRNCVCWLIEMKINVFLCYVKQKRSVEGTPCPYGYTVCFGWEVINLWILFNLILLILNLTERGSDCFRLSLWI